MRLVDNHLSHARGLARLLDLPPLAPLELHHAAHDEVGARPGRRELERPARPDAPGTSPCRHRSTWSCPFPFTGYHAWRARLYQVALKRMYIRCLVPLPGMLARTPIESG